MRKFLYLLMLTALAFYSCDSTSSDNNNLKLDEAVVDQASIGFQVNDVVSNVNQFNSADDIDLDTGGIATAITPAGLVKNVRDYKYLLQTKHNEYKAYSKNISIGFSKTTEDSTIYMVYDTTLTHFSGIIYKLNLSTMKYTLISWKKARQAELLVQSDSTIFIANSNEQLESIQNFKTYKEGIALTKEEFFATASKWDVYGEPTAFGLNSKTYYAEKFQLERSEMDASIFADNSGTITMKYFFRDGTSTIHTITFNNDGTGTFSRTLRDGTKITGTFNDYSDDGEGALTSNTTFPNGYYISTILKSATLAFDFKTEDVTGKFSEKINFADGSQDSISINMNITSSQTQFPVITLTVAKMDGSNGTITLTEAAEITTMNATWTDAEGRYAVVSAEYYGDGSGHLEYKVYLSKTAYDNGNKPIAQGSYDFTPDGWGTGSFIAEGTTYDFEMINSAQAKLTKGSESAVINLY